MRFTLKALIKVGLNIIQSSFAVVVFNVAVKNCFYVQFGTQNRRELDPKPELLFRVKFYKVIICLL